MPWAARCCSKSWRCHGHGGDGDLPASKDRLRIFLPIIQQGVVTTLVVLLRAAEVTMGAGAVKEIVAAGTQSGPTVPMFSNTLTHQSLGYPYTGAWTTILV